jgi:hypothetical protein
VLYSPQQSHLVDQQSLDCARRYGNFWEPASGIAAEASGTADSGETLDNKRRLRLFQPPPQLIAVPAGAIASSAGGGDTSRRDQHTSRPANFGGGGGGGPGDQPSPPGGSRVNRTGLPQGQERTVSYQPEERYWTDYLRIALPVVGLLLMLGLFWYWASAVIGNDNNDPPSTPQNNVALVTDPTLTPTQTVPVQLPQETVTVPATEETGGGEQQPADETPTTESNDPAAEDTPEAAGKGFVAGEYVVTTSGDVNLRADKSTDSESLALLEADTQLLVTEPATQKDGQHYWVGVETPGGQTGYVADEFLAPSEE